MTNDLEKRLAHLSPEKRALMEKKLRALATARAKGKVVKLNIPARVGEGPWPASMDQSSLWFFHQLDPDFIAYNNGATIRIKGPLQVPLLERAASEVMRRHEVLRTVFAYEEETLYQVPLAEVIVACPITDLSDLPRDRVLDLAGAEITKMFSVPFNLESGPLIRFQLVCLEEGDYLMPIIAHHAIIDWWSLKLIPQELLTIYQAYLNGLPSPLPELPLQFIDYTLWRNAWLESDAYDKQLAYWLENLKGVPLVLELPTDRPRAAQQDFHGERLFLPMPDEMLRGIRAINVRFSASSMMTTIAATLAFLSRYSGQKDLLIGTPTTDREIPELESMVGYMLNVLVIRADLTEDPSFGELVLQIKQRVLGALTNKELPFRILADKLSPERELGRMPIYQVDFNHVTIDGPVFEQHARQDLDLVLPGYDLSSFSTERGISDVDLQINFEEGLDEARLLLEWATALFDRETVVHMNNLMQRLFIGMTRDPDTPISRIDWLDEQERRDLLVNFNDRQPDYPRESSIGARVAERARRKPRAPALVGGFGTLSYGDMLTRANHISHYLLEHGIGLGMPVGLCLEAEVDWTVSMLGILSVGGCYVPLDPDYPAERLSFMLGDGGMSLLITNSELMDRLPAQELNFMHVLVLDEERETLAGYPDALPTRSVAAESPAYIIYTSGTTGQPKGVVVPHRAVLRLVYDSTYITVTERDGIGQISNICFDAHVFEVWTALCLGARLCYIDKQSLLDVDSFAALLAERLITTIFMTSALFNQYARDRPALFENLKYLLTGGERFEATSAQAVFSQGPPRNLVHVYGPTETTTFASFYPIKESPVDGANLPIGAPIANTSLYVLADANQPAPLGTLGVLCIGGDGLAQGYLGRPALTATHFIPNPFAGADTAGSRLYHSGDVVKRLRSGAVQFHGRRDNQVKLRGFRIELGEIESLLGSHPEVAETVVVVLGEGSSRGLVAYLTLNEGCGLALGEVNSLHGYLADRLPEYMVPSAFVGLESFPLTPNGKRDLRALPSPENAGIQEHFSAPRSDVEARLAEIWASILKLEKVDIHANFFELGGDSILAIQVISAANSMGLPLSTKHLFQSQTIAELAERVGHVGSIVAEQGPVTGEVPLTPIQLWFLGSGRRRPQHFNMGMHMLAERPLRPEFLADSFARLAVAHDALRMRFINEDGNWRQINAGLEGDHFPFVHHDLSTFEDPCAQLLKLAEATQRSLDLEKGPLARALLCEMGAGQKQRLLIIVHHLTFDGISMRVLLADLERLYTQLESGHEPRAMPKSSSWKYWAERLRDFASSDELLAELDWWVAQADRPGARIPLADENGSNKVATTKHIVSRLTREETRALLQDVPAVYNTRINDILMAALAMAVGRFTGNWSVRIALEGHGREELFDDIDFSRTLGWFTAMFPVVLELDVDSDPGSALKSVKEQLRQVPRNGLGYGLLRYVNPEAGERLAHMQHPQLIFNYLGQMDAEQQDALFSFSQDPAGMEHAPEDHRGYSLETVGVVVGGQLTLLWNYSGEVLAEKTVRALADANEAALRELIAHCLSPEAGGRTPSDFAYVDLEQVELDGLLARYPGLHEIYPAMPLQAGMLYHAFLDNTAPVYREQIYLKVKGRLDAALFARAWQQVIGRHEALRTLFVPSTTGYLQVVLAQFEAKWFIGDISNDDEVLTIRNESLGGTWLLDDTPICRFDLLYHPDNQTSVIWSFHHAALDGWSVASLVRESSRIYEALVVGIKAEPAPEAPYRDYASWFLKQDKQASATYFSNLLAEVDEPSLLRPDLSPTRTLPRYVHLATSLNEAETATLERFIRARGLTMGTLVQGAWALLLMNYLDRDDVLFGVTSSGRPPALEHVDYLIGMFINTLPIRAESPSGMGVANWLKSLQEQQVNSREFDYCPMVDIQGYSGIATGPLFDSLVVFENFPKDESLVANFAGLGLAEIDGFGQTNYPLTLTSFQATRLPFGLAYNAELFEPSFIQRLARHLANLILGLVADENREPLRIPILDEEERRQILIWAGSETAYPRDSSIHQLFAEQVMRTPNSVALVFDSGCRTYAELGERANRFAAYLRAHGVAAGAAVGIDLPEDDPDLIAAFLGTLLAGAAYVPLDRHLPAERLSFIVEDAGIGCLLKGPDRVLDDLISVPCLNAGAVDLDDYAGANPKATSLALQTAYIMYTSGSSGLPKGVAVSHRAVIRLVKQTNYIEFDVEDTVLQASAPSFDASTLEIWGALLNGAGLALLPSVEVTRLAEVIEAHKVTVLWLTTQLFKLMVDEGQTALGGLRCLITGGEAASPGHVQRFCASWPAVRLLNGYGPTENTTFTTTSAFGEDDEAATAIGKPIANTFVYVLRDGLELVAQGCCGELFIGGDGLANGYHRRPALTAAAFLPNPYARQPGDRLYRSGDLVRWSEGARLLFLGRRDGQVKLRGYRIELGEIEEAVRRLDGVEDALVRLLPLTSGDHRLAAWVRQAQPPADQSARVEELRTALASRLPAYMLPASITFVTTFPLKSSGKLDLAALPAPSEETAVTYVAPRNPIEEAVVAVWVGLLERQRIGIHDNFFDLGAHSLMVTRAVTVLNRDLEIELPIKALFEAPTTERLARSIELLIYARETAKDEGDDYDMEI